MDIAASHRRLSDHYVLCTKITQLACRSIISAVRYSVQGDCNCHAVKVTVQPQQSPVQILHKGRCGSNNHTSKEPQDKPRPCCIGVYSLILLRTNSVKPAAPIIGMRDLSTSMSLAGDQHPHQCISTYITTTSALSYHVEP